jgi:hypothetical protein
MATSFPTSKDNLSNPSANDELTGHAAQHTNANDAIEAIQSKLGVDGSNDTNSIDYKVTNLEALVNNVTNSSDAITELLGLEGNNDLTVYGIENPTNIDSFAKNTWRTVKYNLQVTKGNEIYTSELLLTHDGTDIMISETNIISNTNNNLFTYTFEENSGIISLRITPTSGEIIARFIRTAVRA